MGRKRNSDAWQAAPLRERMRALELTRQMVLGYGNGSALPRFQRVLEIEQTCERSIERFS
jgi:hypothetical protein